MRETLFSASVISGRRMGGAASQEAAMKACWLMKWGKTEELRRLLTSHEVDLNAFVQTGYTRSATLLYHAVDLKQYDTITLLLELGASADVDGKGGFTPLYRAMYDSDERAASLLLAHGANVNAVTKGGQTALFRAKSVHIAEFLIQKGADIHHYDKAGASVLLNALRAKNWEFVKLLLRYGANIHHVTKDGGNALHVMAEYHYLEATTMETLVAMGVGVNDGDANGQTPLHYAVKSHLHNIEFLLAAGSDVHAHDKNGHQAIHIVLREIHREGIDLDRKRILQLLVFHGAKWDEQCEHWLANIANRSREQPNEQPTDNLISHDVARAVRLCAQRWMEEYGNGLPPTDIPVEDIKRGYQATKTYLDQLTKSTHVVLRRKICVVGPSNWGKTSLVKSFVAEAPSLVHPGDRTIGIDKFKVSFYQLRSVAGSVVHHEVTFWDFAGQDEYQVAHSLFFSRRTLYLVCIDLSEYATTYYKAEMVTSGDPMALSERMNAFVETRVLRWIRLILARQPDAEFQFVATKDDLMQVVDADALADMSSRLANVLVIVGSIIAGDKGSITHLGDKRLERMKVKPVAEVTVVSCAESESVDVALSKIKSLICRSERSYAMPDSYSEVLRFIKEKRKAAQAATLSSRIDQCFVKVDDLTSELAQAVKGIDKSASRDILRALRDIGDVLWYEDVDDSTLRETVVLDPLLLIDLIRQIFNHKQKSEVLCHADLRQLEVWKYISKDDELMLAMKRLLQTFHLAYPTEKDDEMQWDSDLMLPASWRTKTSAQLMFMGQTLKHPYGISEPRDWQVEVHWEIDIDSGFEEALFDRLVVATYEPAFLPREVGPDYILYGDATSEDSLYACRLIVDWHRVTHKRVLHLEAVLARSPTGSTCEEAPTEWWDRFQCICEGLAAVFRMFPGLRASTSARLGGGDGVRPKLATCTRPIAKWLPPEPTLSECRELLTFTRKARVTESC